MFIRFNFDTIVSSGREKIYRAKTLKSFAVTVWILYSGLKTNFSFHDLEHCMKRKMKIFGLTSLVSSSKSTRKSYKILNFNYS